MKNIIVVIEGGLVQQVRNIPPGVNVKIHDYDSGEDCAPGDRKHFDIKKDKQGRRYEEAIYNKATAI